MANCYLCGKKLGFGSSIPRVASGQKMDFCLKCVIQWDEEQKQKALSSLHEGGDPIPFFTLQNITTQDPSQKDYMFVGHLVFMNKGICFVKLSEFSKKASRSGIGLGGLALGIIGDRWIDQKIANRSPEHQEKIRSAYRHAEQMGSGTLEELLQKGRSFLFFPKQSIAAISYEQKRGLIVKTKYQQCETYFELVPEAYKQVEPLIAEYMGQDN
jgi:hypothetical protein